MLQEALEFLQPENKLIVFNLDHVARSLSHLIEVMNHLQTKQIGFRSLTEQINTTIPGGKLLFHLMAAIAEFERYLIRERILHGLKVARAKGRIGGLPRQITQDKIDAVRMLLEYGAPVSNAVAPASVSVPTLYRCPPRSPR